MASAFVIENSRRKEFLVSKGLDIQDTAAWVQKWHTLQYHCKKNGKPFELSFYEYIEIALEAGLTSPPKSEEILIPTNLPVMETKVGTLLVIVDSSPNKKT